MNSIIRNFHSILSNSITKNVSLLTKSLAVHTDNVQLASNKSKSVSPLVPNEHEAIKHITNEIDKTISDPRATRLFAVVMIGGSQFKVTTEDIIAVRNNFYPTVGDKIRLEKVLLVGGKNFTVVGKPLVSKEFVNVDATVIEKTLTNNTIIFTYKPRKDNRKMRFHKGVLTLLRINSIDIIGPLPKALP